MAQTEASQTATGETVTHPVAMAAQERRFNLRKVLVVVVLYLAAFWTLVPMYWVAVSSVKSLRDLAHIPPRLFPTEPRLDAWVTIFERRILENIYNSLVVATLATIICLIIAVPAAYAATRMRLPFKFVGIVVGLMGLVALLPPIASAIPLFLLGSDLGIIDEKYTLIILYTVLNTAFAVWVLRSTFMDVPMDVEEAALMDGDTRFGAVRRILLPLIFPSLFSIAILLFIFNWNEYIIALYFRKFHENHDTSDCDPGADSAARAGLGSRQRRGNDCGGPGSGGGVYIAEISRARADLWRRQRPVSYRQ